jgi:hypothetical protein
MRTVLTNSALEGAMKALLISTGVAAILVAAASAAIGQTRCHEAEGAEAWVQPRTPWGDPDLQEIWSTEDLRTSRRAA